MMTLLNKSKNAILAQDLLKTGGLLSRMKGLIASKKLTEAQALWIPANNSIHTFFMKYNIDVVFTDRHMFVKAIHKNIPPWRLVKPKWDAFHTFEFLGGNLDSSKIQVGDQLHVGH
jgi:uncharacterized membrane protein (UPF0127 family)